MKCPNCGAENQIKPFCTECTFPLYPTSYKEGQLFADFIPKNIKVLIDKKWGTIRVVNLILVCLMLLVGFFLYGIWMLFIFLAPLGYLISLTLTLWIISDNPWRLMTGFSDFISSQLAPIPSTVMSYEERQQFLNSPCWKTLVIGLYFIYVITLSYMLWTTGFAPSHTYRGGPIKIPLPHGVIIIWVLFNIDIFAMYLIKKWLYKKASIHW